MNALDSLTPSDVSVVIPALNEASNIQSAVASCVRNGAGQILVSDGGSQDGTPELATESGADVIQTPRGRGTQTANGAELATGSVILFLHADNRLTDGSLDALCNVARSHEPGKPFWGGFRQHITDPRRIYRWLEWGNAARVRVRGIPFGDQAIFVQADLYREVGGVPKVPLMEDVRLAQRLRREGWPVLVEATVEVDARRWQKRGVVHQTARNWVIQVADLAGISEARLVKWYR
ncbi:MAG: TIGR04283 family arsenosugar biosynthesis glycosyltransferase [Planctomycetota bacterium]